MTKFHEAVREVLLAIPAGRVVSHREVARLAGYPEQARAVGYLLFRSEGIYPWWRVVTTNGRLVPGYLDLQTKLLEDEGIEVSGNRVVFSETAKGR